ncbi:MAG: Zn-ribbon domain-containing OB-fold protein [Chloroflexi bacterium]|nr:Zn-ribbon domain-containing OB-fold protein [Chloroflexota bacterium]
MAEYRKPIPIPSPETAPFWEASKKRELLIQRCQECGRFYFYPRPLCPHCLSPHVEWVRASGRGTLYTYNINYRATYPGFAADVPYVMAIVELEEGVRLMTNLVDVKPDPDQIKIGMAVEVVFEDVTPDISLPKFRPASRG